jgi:flagella basal body P-ring formation protein FlgA
MTKFQLKQTRQSIFYMCMLTFKSVIFVLVVGFGLLFAYANIFPANAATLKTLSSVNDDVIRLADLFDGVDKNADVVLGNAPLPGKDVVLGARALKRVALAYDVKWEPQSLSEQIVVRRAAHTIGAAAMQDRIKETLAARGVGDRFAVTLSNPSASIVLPASLPDTVEVVDLSYTPGRDVFSATLAAPSAANPVQTLRVSGLIEHSAEVPVLRNPMRMGDVISSADIDWADAPSRTLMPDTILDADDLVGKTPVRQIVAGAPIRDNDIKAPLVVGRGEQITILYQFGSMQMTAKGKAMQNGAAGDMIRVVNLSSNRSLTGEVTGDGLVKIY